MKSDQSKLHESEGFAAPTGSQPLLTRLYNHRAAMDAHQRERYAGKLLMECIAEIESAYAEIKRHSVTIGTPWEAYQWLESRALNEKLRREMGAKDV